MKKLQRVRSKVLSVIWLPILMCISAGATAETYYFHNDQLGTPQVVTSNTQQVVWKGEYGPFGGCTETINLVEQNIRFPGQYFDEETGLHYNYFRTYDPGKGRYLQSDPIGLDGGLSTYGYSYQSPIMYKDPTGELAWGLVFAGANIAYQLSKNGGDLACVDWVDVGLTAVGGGLLGKAFKTLKKARGKEFSHWIPDRYVRPRSLSGKNPNPHYKPLVDRLLGRFVKSRFNGNNVSPQFHAATDPFRNLKGQTRKDTLNPLLSIPIRTPSWIPGLGAFGTAGYTDNNCGKCK